MGDAEIIRFPVPDDIRLCWKCMERVCLDDRDAWGLCQRCLWDVQ